MEYGNAVIIRYRDKWRGQVKFKDENGKWHSTTKMLTAKGKREAQKQADQWRAQLQREADIASGIPTTDETVLQYVERYIESKAIYIEPSSSKEYRRLLKKPAIPTWSCGTRFAYS